MKKIIRKITVLGVLALGLFFVAFDSLQVSANSAAKCCYMCADLETCNNWCASGKTNLCNSCRTCLSSCSSTGNCGIVP